MPGSLASKYNNIISPVQFDIDIKQKHACNVVIHLLLEFDGWITIITLSRSDAQRTAKQKERKEQDLEKFSFNAEILEEQFVNITMVRI